MAFAEINEQLIKDTVAGIADIRASAEGKEGVQSFLQNVNQAGWRKLSLVGCVFRTIQGLVRSGKIYGR